MAWTSLVGLAVGRGDLWVETWAAVWWNWGGGSQNRDPLWVEWVGVRQVSLKYPKVNLP